eukprot:TRINITY_DN4363_c0_g1_i1.p1 TRINITY_DN4363_c0_g1~~TRINITY_DN4363_c0_g1_i1.p1  ORF type:complete len:528 (+),score=110.89 TRINITY_DN4363_c0_g1_i1:71-1654(+)
MHFPPPLAVLCCIVASVVLSLSLPLARAQYSQAHSAGGSSLPPTHRVAPAHTREDDEVEASHTLVLNVFYPPEKIGPKTVFLLGTDIDWVISDPEPPFRPLPQAYMNAYPGEPGRYYAKLLVPASLNNSWFNYTVLIKEMIFSPPQRHVHARPSPLDQPSNGHSEEEEEEEQQQQQQQQQHASPEHPLIDPFGAPSGKAHAGSPLSPLHRRSSSDALECDLMPGAQTPSITRSHVFLDGDTSADLYPFFCALQGSLETLPGVYSPQFNDTRDIFLWTPPSLTENPTPRDLRVMFLNDGQILPTILYQFLDTLAISGLIEDTLVVGVTVDSKERQYQLTPTPCTPCQQSPYCSFDCACEKGGASGGAPLYYDFLIDTLLPLVLKHTNMMVKPNGVALGGWSYGGLNACYGAYTRPHHFATGYCGSPSVWWNCEQLRESVFPDASPPPTNITLLFDVGSAEGDAMVPPTERLYEEAVRLGFVPGVNTWLDVVDGDYHTLNAFATRFWNVGPRILGSPFVRSALQKNVDK